MMKIIRVILIVLIVLVLTNQIVRANTYRGENVLLELYRVTILQNAEDEFLKLINDKNIEYYQHQKKNAHVFNLNMDLEQSKCIEHCILVTDFEKMEIKFYSYKDNIIKDIMGELIK